MLKVEDDEVEVVETSIQQTLEKLDKFLLRLHLDTNGKMKK
jgi:hypothetical protein